MPEAVDPGIQSGFQAADQQSYLQTILANTRASQENQARLKEEQEQMFVDPTAFAHGDGVKLAAGARPDGKLIFKNAAALTQAMDLDKRKYDEKIGLDANEATAKNAVQLGIIKPGHPAYASIEMALARKPLPTLNAKHLEDLGRVASSRAKGATSIDAYGNTIGTAPETQTGIPLDVQRAREEGHEVTRTIKDDGTISYSVKETVDSGDSLNAYTKANYGGRTWNALNPDEKKESRAEWIKERRADKGLDQTAKIQITTDAEERKGVGPKEITKYYSYDKGYAADTPGLEKLNHSQLVTAGFYNRDTGEGAPKFAKDQRTFRTAEEHINMSQDVLGEIANRRPDLYPPWADNQKMTSVARAKATKIWRTAWLNQSDPDVARIMALDHAAMRLQAALNPTGTRFGLGMLYYAADGSPSSANAPFSKESLFANIDTWKQNMEASRRGHDMPGIKDPSSSYAPSYGKPGYVPPGQQTGHTPMQPRPAGPPSVGVSGSTGFKKWMEQGGGRQ
jgi:hypothetical protein